MKRRPPSDVFMYEMRSLQGSDSSRYARLADHYKVLGVAPDASFREVQRAYWRLAFGGLHNADRAALNSAYEVLGNERRRREYDQLRADSGLDGVEAEAPVQRPAPPVDAGLRGRLGWPPI